MCSLTRLLLTWRRTAFQKSELNSRKAVEWPFLRNWEGWNIVLSLSGINVAMHARIVRIIVRAIYAFHGLFRRFSPWGLVWTISMGRPGRIHPALLPRCRN